ncbi:MAG TPA: 4Fe-4S dicluster domain-containing protein [Candidatus Binatia bacterium]|nr:4Fe-4S dicluster domain-containing protein [Candidatus Binatia bacterium]
MAAASAGVENSSAEVKNMSGQARGNITINVDECKGCGLCVESCPPKCLELAPELSHYGVHPARYTGHDCTGCGICFYCCPEPGAITVYRLAPPPKAPRAQTGGEHAATV